MIIIKINYFLKDDICKSLTIIMTILKPLLNFQQKMEALKITQGRIQDLKKEGAQASF